MIYRLVYYSRVSPGVAGHGFAATVDDILSRSRANNRRDGITGALLFNAGCFAQVLEGPLGTVEAAFERIQQDERHGDVSLLAMEEVAARSFPDWSMGFVGTRPGDAAAFAAVGRDSGFDPSRLDGDELHLILRDLAVEEERFAA
jgi:hypothetical protein